MRRPLACAAVLAVALVTALSAAAGNHGFVKRSSAFTLAVIGDTPYGDAQLAAFPDLVSDVNGDPDVELGLHLGDIKTGSSLCTDAYFAGIHALFETFRDPLLFTPGDNEWTDCHRANNGGYLPTERLAKLRATFYPKPGRSLGRRTKFVDTQADVPGFAPFVENQLWKQSKVVFAMVHVVGSNNDLVPWFGAAETAEQRATRLAEYEARLAAALEWLDRTFALADESDARGVVVGMQADMWAGGTLTGFNAIVQRLADRARAFGGPVLLLEGDTHDYLVDQPLASGSPVHGVTTAAPNLTRIVVEGETASEWLRLTVDPQAAQLFAWERVVVPLTRGHLLEDRTLAGRLAGVDSTKLLRKPSALQRVRGWKRAKVLGGSVLVALAGWTAVSLAAYAVGLVRAGPSDPSTQMARIIDQAASDGWRVVESRSVDSRGTGELSRLLVLRSAGGSDEMRIYDLRGDRLVRTLRFRPSVPGESPSDQTSVWMRISKVDDLDGNGTSEVIAHLAFAADKDRDLTLMAYPVMIVWDWARNEHALVPLLGTQGSPKGVLKLAKLRNNALEELVTIARQPWRFADRRAGVDFRAHSVQEFDVRRTDAGAFLVGAFVVGAFAPTNEEDAVLMAAQVRFWRIRPWRLGAPLSACDGAGRIFRVPPDPTNVLGFLPSARLGNALDRAFRGFAPSACL